MNKISLSLRLVFVAIFCLGTQAFSQTISSLPPWYENNKAHAHSRFLFTDNNCPYIPNQPSGLPYCYLDTYPDYFERIKTRVNTRHIKGHLQGAAWCSSEPNIHNGINPNTGLSYGPNIAASCIGLPGTSIDIPDELINAADNAGIAQILYYRHEVDHYYQAQHADWICREYGGQDEIPWIYPGPSWLCVNSPYREVLKNRFQELTAKGTNGFYFDHWHNPFTGCWCTNCEQTYDQWGEAAHNDLPNPQQDPFEVLKFYNYSVRQHFTEIQNAIHAVDPKAVAIVGTHRFAALNERTIDAGLARIADVPKSEYETAIRWASNRWFYVNDNDATPPLGDYQVPIDIRMGVGWSTLRDLTPHRTIHVWTPPNRVTEGAQMCSDNLPPEPFTSDQLRSYLGAAYAFGFTLNAHLFTPGNAIPTDPIILDAYEDMYEIDNVLGSKIGNMRPIKWTAILYDDDIKNAELRIAPSEGTQESLWKKYLLNYHAAFEAVKNYRNEHLNLPGYFTRKFPVYMLDKEQFLNGETDGIVNIIVPNKSLYTDASSNNPHYNPSLAAQLDAFGGSPSKKVIYVDEVLEAHNIANNTPGNYDEYYNVNNSTSHGDLLKLIHNPIFGPTASRPRIYVQGNNDSGTEVFAEFYEQPSSAAASVGAVPLYNYVVALSNDIEWSVPPNTWWQYECRNVIEGNYDNLDFKDPTVPGNEPAVINQGTVTVRIDPKLCFGVLKDIPVGTSGAGFDPYIKAYDLYTGNQMSFNTYNGTEITLAIPNYHYIKAIGIDIVPPLLFSFHRGR